MGVWPGIVCTGLNELFTSVLASQLADSVACTSLNSCLNSNFASSSNLRWILRSWDSIEEPVSQHTFEIIKLTMFCIAPKDAPQLSNTRTS